MPINGHDDRDFARRIQPTPLPQSRPRIGVVWNVVIVALLLAVVVGLLFAAGVL